MVDKVKLLSRWLQARVSNLCFDFHHSWTNLLFICLASFCLFIASVDFESVYVILSFFESLPDTLCAGLVLH